MFLVILILCKNNNPEARVILLKNNINLLMTQI